MDKKISSGSPKRHYFSLGLWNVYFICKFLLAASGYLRLNLGLNALLFVFIVFPLSGKWINGLRHLAAAGLALALLWSESWLPGPQSIIANLSGIADFSLNYVVQLAIDFINPTMAAAGLGVLLAYLAIKDFVRVSTITGCWLAVLFLQPLWQSSQEIPPVSFVTAQTNVDPTALMTQPAQTDITPGEQSADKAEIENWYKAFLTYEKDRIAKLPSGISAKDTPFDIVIMNICSLSNDDLEAAKLQNHRALTRFNIRFDHFNSATAYSGPATLRLLKSACGQPSHDDLYGERKPDCEIMNRLDSLGFKQHLFLDHSGAYDNYLNTLRTKAGLTAPLERRKYPLKYMSFNDEEIADTLSVLRHWQRVVTRGKDARTVSLFNFIALHDGNRFPRHSRWEAFEPRAKTFLDNLNTFMNELERTNRKVMLIVVPEHGAAVRGDRIQAPRLRDIPSMRITQVPVLVKFFGLKDLPKGQLHVPENVSYLAMSSLIGRVIESNYFSKQTGAVPMTELLKDLPMTHPVSENGQAIVLRYKGRDYLKQNRGQWEAYTGN